MPEVTWEQALDGMEAHLADHDGALGEWQPPVGLGPVPAHLHDRARNLLARISAATTAVRTEIAQLDNRKKMVRAVPTFLPADAPQYLDEAL